MKPGQFTVDDKTSALTWCVGYHLHQREEAEYDTDLDDILESYVETNGIRFTKFVAIPHLGVLAVADRISDTSLGGMAGVSRFKSVMRSVKGAKAVVQLAATSQDVDQALSTWSVEQFSFSLRPFNPTPKRMGKKLHDLFITNGIGQMRGVALPTTGEYIHDTELLPV